MTKTRYMFPEVGYNFIAIFFPGKFYITIKPALWTATKHVSLTFIDSFLGLKPCILFKNELPWCWHPVEKDTLGYHLACIHNDNIQFL